MINDWPAANRDLSEALATYRQAAPDVAAAFGGLAKASTRPAAIDAKTKELIALAIGIAGRCDGCIGFHTEAAIRHGATRDEVVETIGVAMLAIALAMRLYPHRKRPVSLSTPMAPRPRNCTYCRLPPPFDTTIEE